MHITLIKCFDIINICDNLMSLKNCITFFLAFYVHAFHKWMTMCTNFSTEQKLSTDLIHVVPKCSRL